MAKFTCAVSGLTLRVEGLSANIPASTGYYHPVFMLSEKQLFTLYSSYKKGTLNNLDSYLMLCGFLHHSDLVEWESTLCIDPNSPRALKVIQSNIKTLLWVVKTNARIANPRLKLPRLRISPENNDLSGLNGWLKACVFNIVGWTKAKHDAELTRDIAAIEESLQKLIKSGETYTAKFADRVAGWAILAGDLPADYEPIIRSCFNQSRIIGTPLDKLKEIKTAIEDNIPAGDIYFHALMEVINAGIVNHLDYLGTATGENLGFTLLPTNSVTQAEVDALQASIKKENAILANIAANAPKEEPKEKDYPSKLSYIKAMTAYRMAKEMTGDSDNDLI